VSKHVETAASPFRESDVPAVFGATGISGTACLQALLKTPPTEYKSILAVSRRPPTVKSADGRIKHVNVDLMGSVHDIAKGLRDAGGEEAKHVFFYSYIAQEEEEDLVETNKKLFGNVSPREDLPVAPFANAELVVRSFGSGGYQARSPAFADRLQV
jgi:hypothetical protein